MTSFFTIFGASGFIGRHVARQLVSEGHVVRPVTRDNWPERGEYLGNVIYSVGVTANFRYQIMETFAGHVERLFDIVAHHRFSSFLYVSSTRVYQGATLTHEDAALTVHPLDANYSYNISKLAGESIVLGLDHPAARVARVSNVFGTADASPSFLTSVLREAAATGACCFLTAPESSKDYIHIDDVVSYLTRIASGGQQRLYNVASGSNISNATIASWLVRSGIRVSFVEDASVTTFPLISTIRIQSEFGLSDKDIALEFATSLEAFKRSVL